MIQQPQACFDCGCPLAGKATGFVLGSGDPKTAKMALLLETPTGGEIAYLTKDLHDGLEEIRRRSEKFQLGDSHIRLGVPAVGPSGYELFQWALRSVGIQRSDLYIENVLHCWPPQERGGAHYPIGKDRKKAEGCCMHLWSRLDEFAPTAAVVNFNPASIMSEVTPLPIQIRAFERAKQLMFAGHRVVVCCGGKAAGVWFGYAENVTRWAVHHQMETEFTRRKRAERWIANRRLSVEKKVKVVKVKKMTAKSALAELLQSVVPSPHAVDYYVSDVHFTKGRWDEMLSLCAPKVKKTKGEVG